MDVDFGRLAHGESRIQRAFVTSCRFRADIRSKCSGIENQVFWPPSETRPHTPAAHASVFWGLVVMDGPAQTDKLRMANAALRDIPSIAGALHNSPGALLAEVRRLYQQLARLPRFDQAEPNTARRPTAAYLALEAQIRGLAERYREGPGDVEARGFRHRQ